jgi:bacteriocin biosynthesis cyclodehydratase domain-containing protein
MAPLIGVIGSLQAMEAIKLLANYGKPASGKIVMYDAMTCQFREMKLMRNPTCEVCGSSNRETSAPHYCPGAMLCLQSGLQQRIV